tara:strand:+ start:1445 stop:1651 length:207 start_codon:yes stop_codon:yes gene_type:complete
MQHEGLLGQPTPQVQLQLLHEGVVHPMGHRDLWILLPQQLQRQLLLHEGLYLLVLKGLGGGEGTVRVN